MSEITSSPQSYGDNAVVGMQIYPAVHHLRLLVANYSET
jgi:hypothetical protein